MQSCSILQFTIATLSNNNQHNFQTEGACSSIGFSMKTESYKRDSF